MEKPVSNFLIKLGGLRLELKNISDSMNDVDASKSELIETLAQLDAVMKSLTSIVKSLPLHSGNRKLPRPLDDDEAGRSVSSVYSTANRQRAADVYLDLLCAEIPQICPDWIVYSRSASTIELYQIFLNPASSYSSSSSAGGGGNFVLELTNCVFVKILPETDETSVKLVFKYESTRSSGRVGGTDESETHRFEFTPENFLESFVGALKTPVDVKCDVVKMEPAFDRSGISGVSPDAAHLVNGTDRGGEMALMTVAETAMKPKNKRNSIDKQPGPKKRRNTAPLLDESRPHAIKYEYLDDASNHAVVSIKSEDPVGVHRPSRSSSAFVQYSELDDDYEDDDDCQFNDDDYLPSAEMMKMDEDEEGEESDRPLEETAKKRKRKGAGAEILNDSIFGNEFPDFGLLERDTMGGDVAASVSVDAVKSKERPKKTKSKSVKKINDNRSTNRKRLAKDDKDLVGNPLECSLCGKNVKRSESSAHMAECHDKPGFQCCNCLKEYPNVKDFRRHMRTTHGNRSHNAKLLPCKECSLLVNASESVEHSRIEHQKPLECPFCDYGSASKDLSELHVNLMLQHSQTAVSESQKLKRHVITDHFNVAFKRLRCQYCQNCFKTQEMMDEHTNRDLDPTQRTVGLCTKMRAEGEKEEKTICPQCGESFNVSYIKFHIQRIHENNMPHNYKCQFCPKRYNHPKGLREHLLQIHFPEKKDLACHLCPKKYASHRMLSAHIKTHSDPKVECPQCDKGELNRIQRFGFLGLFIW